MQLPKQVEAQVKRAEELEAQLRNLAEQEQQTVDEQAQVQGEPEQGDPVHEQAQQQEVVSEQTRGERTDYKAKYLVLKGKYDAEVPRFAADLRSARDENATLKAKLDEANAALAEARKAAEAAESVQAKASEDEALDVLTQEYGPEFGRAVKDMIGRLEQKLAPIQAKAEQAAQALEEQRKREQETKQQQERDSRSREFADAVNDLVPDWEAIDKMPAFHAYLAEIGADGRSRQEVLMEAANRFDAAGAARIFTAFKRTEAFPKAQATPPQQRKDVLRSQVVPEATGRAAAQPTGKIWTSSEIKAFFKDVSLGKIDPDEARKTERDIDAASREGRIRG